MPYDEHFYLTQVGPALASDYGEAQRVIGDDSAWVVWPARVQADIDGGLSASASFIKHRLEWRAALGLVPPFPPAPWPQKALGHFDADDPGGNISRSCPPEQVIPVGPDKRFWRGDFGGMTLVDHNGAPIQLQQFPGVTNTTPPNMYMTFLSGIYTRADLDQLLTGHCERSYTHYHATADPELLAYVLTWTNFASCWILGDHQPAFQSWLQAAPLIDAFLSALILKGPAVCEKVIAILGKEVNSSFTPYGLLDTVQHYGPIFRDHGIELALHFSPRVASWQLPTETPVAFWQKMSAAGVRRGCYQAIPTNPPGTIIAQLWDMRKYLAAADPTLACTFFEGFANEQLMGRKTEEDGCRLGLEAVFATRPAGSNAPAVAGAGNGLRNLDGSPV